MRKQVAIVSVAVWLALLAACGGRSGGGGQLAGQQIGPAGGEVAVLNGALAGAKVVVPPNAVNAPVTITIEAGTAVAVTAGDVTVGPAVRLGPSGTTFLVPVTVTLPFSAAQAGGEPVRVAHRDDVTRVVTIVPNPVVNHATGLVSVEISSFSTLQPAFTPPGNPPVFDDIVFANRCSSQYADI